MGRGKVLTLTTYAGVIGMARIIFQESDQFLRKGLLNKEVQQLSKLALERFIQNSSNYFTVVKKGESNNIIVTDGNDIVFRFSPIKLNKDLDEDLWIIIDDYRTHPQSAIQINFLLPKEY